MAGEASAAGSLLVLIHCETEAKIKHYFHASTVEGFALCFSQMSANRTHTRDSVY